MIVERLLKYFLLCACLGTAHSAVLRVPSEYATIQAALDSLEFGDTVLVAQGEYHEALLAPTVNFSLIGDVPVDTGLFERPIIDPSSLDNADSLSCLRNTSGSVYIERIWFRNRSPMFPHEFEIGGGIHNGNAHLYLTDCVFDSTFRGVLSFDGSVTAERCIFIQSVHHCLRLGGGAIEAHDCIFECVNTEWAAVIGGAGTNIEFCQWRGFMGLWEWWLALGSTNYRVANCVFGPGGGSNMPLVNLSGRNGVVEDNLFLNCESRRYVVNIGGECNENQIFRRNRFVNTQLHFNNGEGFACLVFGGQLDDNWNPCLTSIVEDNSFEGTEGGIAATAVVAGGPDDLRHSQFRDLNTPTLYAVLIDGDDIKVGECLFSNTVRAVGTESENYDSVDARHNWWGHESGPYHPTRNPEGQGDMVGDGIDFVPWYTDTLFFTDSPEPRPPLPETASLLAYPNPFNQTTTLQLSVPRAGIARVELFDITGRRVQELWSGPLVDTKEITWNASNFATGLYFVRAWDPLGNRPLAMTKVVLMK